MNHYEQGLMRWSSSGWSMSKLDSTTPSLEDALAAGFAELKAGEETFEQPQPAEVLPQSEQQIASSPDYGQQIRHVEDRKSFTVTPTKPSPVKQEPTSERKSPAILDAPSSGLGEDFDVEW